MLRNLGRFFRRGGGVESQQRVVANNLSDQSWLPPPLRLPRPAEPMARMCAGLADLALSAALGASVAAACHYGGGLDAVSAVGVGQGTSLMLWAARDGLGPGGNRSPGKALFKLELVNSDGTLVSPLAGLCRSSYFLLLPATPLHPFVGLTLEVLLFWDIATLVLTPDARKAGDYMWGSRVVEELPDRHIRMLDYMEGVEVEELREKIEKVAPGWLEEEGLAKDVLWHTPRVGDKSILAGAKPIVPLPPPPPKGDTTYRLGGGGSRREG